MHKEPKFHITEADELAKVVEWIKAGRGILMWQNVCIGDSAGAVITPGDSSKPYWKYDRPQPITSDWIKVEHRVPVEPVAEWYPVCEKCQGTAERSLAKLADIRGETIEQVRELASKPSWNWGEIKNDMFPCNYCRGKGHAISPITFRVTRTFYGGFNLSAAGKRKCEAMAVKLKEHYGIKAVVAWDWRFESRNMASAYFFAVTNESLASYLQQIGVVDGTVAG